LTSIPGFASSISYHPTGRVAEILHANGQRFTEQGDPHGMARPEGLRLSVDNGTRVRWSLEPFAFDGSGNLTAAGGWIPSARYDRLGRWIAATMIHPRLDIIYTAGAAYDDFGNLTGLSRGEEWIETPTHPATNRLESAAYDASGNLTAWHGQTFSHDPLGRLAGRCTSWDAGKEQCLGADWAYAYGPDEGRVLSYRFAPGTREWIWTDQPVRREGEQPYSIWTLRDEGGRVLHERRFLHNGAPPEMEDYVWRGEGVLAAFLRPQGTVRHFALDHLGSVRVVSDGSGALLEQRSYEPYGHNPIAPQLDERRQWAGHERDLGDLSSPEDDLDYMQARFYSATLGRFLSFDPVGGNAPWPQTWNRYGYALGNPLKYVDPLGLMQCLKTGNDSVGCSDEVIVTPGEGAGGLPPTSSAIEYAIAMAEFAAFTAASLERSDSRDSALSLRLSLGEHLLSLVPAEPAQRLGNAVVGFGDIVSFGLTEVVRDEMGLENTIQEDSSAYVVGSIAGVGHVVAAGGLVAARATIGLQTRVAIHGAHHSFGTFGRMRHLQVNWWRAGVKGSGGAWRFPFWR